MTRGEPFIQDFGIETNTLDRIQELVDEAYEYFIGYSIYEVLDKERAEAVRIMQRLYMGADIIEIEKYLDVLELLKTEVMGKK